MHVLFRHLSSDDMCCTDTFQSFHLLRVCYSGYGTFKGRFLLFQQNNGVYEELWGLVIQKGSVTGRFDVKVGLVEGNKTRQKSDSEVDRMRF